VKCFRFIAAQKADEPISLLRRALAVSRSGFRAWERQDGEGKMAKWVTASTKLPVDRKVTNGLC
jgi:hypothetical protein